MRRLGVGRIDVQNAAAPAELAGQFNGVGVLIAVFDEPAGQLFEVGGSPAAENTSPRSELGTVGDSVEGGIV